MLKINIRAQFLGVIDFCAYYTEVTIVNKKEKNPDKYKNIYKKSLKKKQQTTRALNFFK